MSFSTRYTPAVLLTVLCIAATVFAQSNNPQGAKAPRGSVSGRVTIKDKGAPGVAVGLRKAELNPFEQQLKATTDHDGFYRIANVPPGSYEVAPSAPAFVTVDIQRGKTVVLGDDENVDGVNFSLVRGGVITGKVTDADGRPVIQQQVSLFPVDAFAQPSPARPQQQPQPPRQIFPAGGAQTDDRGIYRMYGLRAGRYKVATGRSDEVFSVGFGQTRSSYQQVFHPDVTEQATATIIEVSEGSEANNVDIKLGSALQTFSVSGRVMDVEKGLPVPNINFGLQRLTGQRGEFMPTPLTSNSQGDFFAEGLIAGKYQIMFFQDLTADLRAESVTFEIIDQDLSDVVIKLSKGASVSGVVVVETENKTARQKLQQMRLMAYVPGSAEVGGAYGRSGSSVISPDGSFRIGGLPAGTVNLSLNPMMMPYDLKGFAISRIERDGIVLPRVEIREGENLAGLRVVLVYGNGTIRGVVKVENGTLSPDARMIVRLAKPGGEGLGGIRPSQVDARGLFLIEGIPTGNYEVTLTVFGAGVPPGLRLKREVSVQDGVVSDVMITVDLTAPQPKP